VKQRAPRERSAAQEAITYGFLALFLVYSAFPLVWMAITSIKPEDQATEFPPRFIPRTVTLENYLGVLTETLMPRFILNSLVLSFGTIACVLLLGTLAAYGFSRYRFPGRDVIFVGLLASVMISGISTIVPLYVMFRELDLLNTYWPLLCIYTSQALPISIWLLKAYFDAIPREIDEAGLIDGCSRPRVLMQLILPVSRPALVAVSMYSFVVVWREFIIAATFAADVQIKTMPVGLYMFFTELGIEWGKLSAAAILVALPPMILIVAFQKWFNPGSVAGAIR
jgi:ABC-type glycerol-3-phosphate transport system permease component